MASSIGIKLADGTFFPILDEDALAEKTLELTTVRDEQESVQINLFKKMDDIEPEYIGSLIVEEIAKEKAGVPTINLKIKLDEEKNLSAEAVDEASGSRQSLKVSLKTVDMNFPEVPDFNLTTMDEGLEIGADPEREDVLVPEYETNSDIVQEEEKKEKKRMPVWLLVLLVLLCIAALVFAILLLTKQIPFTDKNKIANTTVVEEKKSSGPGMNSTTTKPPKESEKEKAAAEAKKKAEQEAKLKAEEEAKKKAEEAKLKAAQEAKQKAEAEAKKKAEEEEARKRAEQAKKSTGLTTNAEGVVRYKIKWGDTLWDLSETFYKTPWLYKKIATYNKIKNPNLIISGTYIDIPPK